MLWLLCPAQSPKPFLAVDPKVSSLERLSHFVSSDSTDESPSGSGHLDGSTPTSASFGRTGPVPDSCFLLVGTLCAHRLTNFLCADLLGDLVKRGLNLAQRLAALAVLVT